jgi:archaellum component FlaG (FlaF/FlaG flagellin family)
MNKLFCLFLAVIVLSGCSSLRIVPDPVPSGIINQKDNSITVANNNIIITAAASDPEMVNYNIEGMVSSFQIEIQNMGESEIAFDTESFLLVDSGSRQYYALSPEKIRQMMAKDTYYLLPYPYVGFYYLEDYEHASFKNTTNTSLPYYYELYPQDIYSKALPVGDVIPKAKISGLIYFHANLSSLDSFKLLVYRKGSSKSADPVFSIPFRVLK